MARLLETLDELGLTDSTLVILTADHGEGFGEHNYYWHGLMSYDTGARVPLVVSHPRLGNGVVDQPVSLIDLAPTILDFLRLPIPSQFQGRSLSRLLSDPGARLDREFVFSEAGREQDTQRSIRTDSFKLIFVPSERQQGFMSGDLYELYDLRNDPGETDNLVRRRAEIRDELAAELHLWIDSDLLTVEAPGEPEELSGELRERIEALGYVQ